MYISGILKTSNTIYVRNTFVDGKELGIGVISNLSASKPRCVRLVGIEPVDKSVHALFSIIWQHKKLDLLHIGELSCTWDYTDSQYKIKNVELTLKPFIRSDYLSILSSSSDANKVK